MATDSINHILATTHLSITYLSSTVKSHLSPYFQNIHFPTDIPPVFQVDTSCTCSPWTLIPRFLAALTPLSSSSSSSSSSLSSALRTHTLLTSGLGTLLDILVLAPGIHTEQDVDSSGPGGGGGGGGGPSGGEYPATAAMTTGYVFRTENAATVYWMQRVGVTGALVTLSVAVSPPEQHHDDDDDDVVVVPRLPYLATRILTCVAAVACILMRDWWCAASLGLLVTARGVNIWILRWRAGAGEEEKGGGGGGWYGKKEPGVVGDLLVLVSQDRWVRMRGMVDDLKAVTSGRWLREMTTGEGWLACVAAGMVYGAGACALCSSLGGSVVVVLLLVGSAGLLAWSNARTTVMRMHGRTIRVVGLPKKYERRLDMAKELINEHDGRDDWAIGLGMIVPDRDKVKPATM